MHDTFKHCIAKKADDLKRGDIIICAFSDRYTFTENSLCIPIISTLDVYDRIEYQIYNDDDDDDDDEVVRLSLSGSQLFDKHILNYDVSLNACFLVDLKHVRYNDRYIFTWTCLFKNKLRNMLLPDGFMYYVIDATLT